MHDPPASADRELQTFQLESGLGCMTANKAAGGDLHNPSCYHHSASLPVTAALAGIRGRRLAVHSAADLDLHIH